MNADPRSKSRPRGEQAWGRGADANKRGGDLSLTLKEPGGVVDELATGPAADSARPADPGLKPMKPVPAQDCLGVMRRTPMIAK